MFLFCILLAIVSLSVGVILMKKSKTSQYDADLYRGFGYGCYGATAFFLILSLFACITVVHAGHVGVVDIFGNVSSKPITSGISIVNPFASVHELSTQTKEVKETMHVLSSEGLAIGLEVSVLYSMNPDSAVSIYKNITGGDYENVILLPNFRSVCRAVTASYEASSLYSTDRDKLATALHDELSAVCAKKGIIIESTPLRNVALPEQLASAIEQKQKADQESQRMEFVLTKEKQEAERKRIEAQGISDFQHIVSAGISDQLLQWKGIEATEKLAHSENTKVIIIGAGKDGLPLIMDTK